MNKTELRLISLQEWLSSVLKAEFTLQTMKPGAGLRRYHRVKSATASFVVMDSQPDAKFFAFKQLAQSWLSLGVQVPVIYAADNQQGFLLLSDFGEATYGEMLTQDNADHLYQQAFKALLRIQSYPLQGEHRLPDFDLVHYREKMGWFFEFYCRHILKCSLTAVQQAEHERLLDLIVGAASQQPQACVHYDYHSRNLILLPDNQTGVLDFQDAVRGPLTYDLMALLRDCYLDWPVSWVQAWLLQYQQAALTAGLAITEDPALWRRWCDFSSVQRHIKCIGLFSRFKVTGHSADYLVYIPRLLNYLREISARYPEMASLHELVRQIPR